jgi:hypothetical protein
MRQNSNITLEALRQKLPREYAWLLQNDAGWLEGHKPRHRGRNQATPSVDWKKRDAEYAVAVKVAASHIKDAPGRPVQVTRTAVGRIVGAITLLRQKLHKMPLTSQMLKSVVETREQYAIRRIWWAVNLCLKEKIMPRKWQLMQVANIYSLREITAVKCAIETAIEMIDLELSPKIAAF